MIQANAVQSQRSIRFRGRSFLAFVLVPEPPIERWLEGLDKWARNSPAFFNGRPVVLDLTYLVLDSAGIRNLIGMLGERGIRIVGCENVKEELLAPPLPPLLKGGRPAATEADADSRALAAADEVPRPEKHGLLIDAPIRSGQCVVFPYGDVTVIGSVASGAEVAAGGSIHIYGTMRGRALAGSLGNKRARIFCSRNEAELLAIDGYYLTAEDMDAGVRGRPAQAWLQGGSLSITPLD